MVSPRVLTRYPSLNFWRIHEKTTYLGLIVSNLAVQADPTKIIIEHTIVPSDFSQKGTGKALLKAAISYMRENQLTTMPT